MEKTVENLAELQPADIPISIAFSILKETVATARGNIGPKNKNILIMDILEAFINDKEGDAADEIKWSDLKTFLEGIVQTNEYRHLNKKIYDGFSYEVLRWVGLLDVLKVIVPGEILYALQHEFRAMSMSNCHVLFSAEKEMTETDTYVFNCDGENQWTLTYFETPNEKGISIKIIELDHLGKALSNLTKTQLIDSEKIPDTDAKRIQNIVTRYHRDKMKVNCLCRLDNLSIWGENPYALTLMACSQLLDYGQAGEYRGKIKKLDKDLSKATVYCDELIKLGVIDNYAKKSLFGGPGSVSSPIESIPKDIVLLIAELFFSSRHPIFGTVDAFKDMRSLMNTCRRMRGFLTDDYNAKKEQHGLKVKLRLGSDQSGCLLENGEVWVWGKDHFFGQQSLIKVRGIPQGHRVIELQLGYRHGGCLLDNGDVWMWGSNIVGQLGIGSNTDNQSSPVKVRGLPQGRRVVQLQLAAYHSGCLLDNGEVWMWGHNNHGQLDNGNTDDQPNPAKVGSLPQNRRVVQFRTGDSHSCYLLENGEVWMWGDNSNGQLGIGNYDDQPIPVRVRGLPRSCRVVQLQVGAYHSACLLDNGEVWMWGFNHWGQLGSGDWFAHPSPVKVRGLPQGCRVVQLQVGGGHSACLLDNGEVWMWGSNVSGELGIGNTDNKSSPVKVAGLPQSCRVVQLQSGGDHIACLLDRFGCGEIIKVDRSVVSMIAFVYQLQFNQRPFKT